MRVYSVFLYQILLSFCTAITFLLKCFVAVLHTYPIIVNKAEVCNELFTYFLRIYLYSIQLLCLLEAYLLSYNCFSRNEFNSQSCLLTTSLFCRIFINISPHLNISHYVTSQKNREYFSCNCPRSIYRPSANIENTFICQMVGKTWECHWH